tara:strand:- start:1047 stop:1853 length:807 start_codon:yes stop_codon:yes gene_type:complete
MNRPLNPNKKTRMCSPNAGTTHPARAAQNDVVLINDSCFDAIQDLPDASVRLIIIDPPYNMLAPGKSNRYKTQWKDKKWKLEEWKQLLPHLWRILQRGGRLLVFGKKRFFFQVCNIIDNEKSHGYDELVWVHGRKDNMWATHQELSTSERIAVFYRKADSAEMKLSVRPDHSDMLHFPKDSSFKSMKPPALKQYLIERYSGESDTVMDICMHTGVTGYAAVRAGRRFVGIERVPELFDATSANLKRAAESADRALRVHMRVRADVVCA